MPIYEFKCSQCDLQFERTLKISDTAAVPCPSCSAATQKMIPRDIAGMVGEPTSIPKDIDKAVGADAERKWMEYEDRKSEKEKLRKETGSQRLGRTTDGAYTPLTVTKDGEKVSEQEAVTMRKEMFKEFETIKRDPDTEKVQLED